MMMGVRNLLVCWSGWSGCVSTSTTTTTTYPPPPTHQRTTAEKHTIHIFALSGGTNERSRTPEQQTIIDIHTHMRARTNTRTSAPVVLVFLAERRFNRFHRFLHFL
uniref:Putative secreted protein n=1 Tax=Anopheles marajoara TaxID=58244 RepID=A0A2M4C8B5_9DIPT